MLAASCVVLYSMIHILPESPWQVLQLVLQRVSPRVAVLTLLLTYIIYQYYLWYYLWPLPYVMCDSKWCGQACRVLFLAHACH